MTAHRSLDTDALLGATRTDALRQVGIAPGACDDVKTIPRSVGATTTTTEVLVLGRDPGSLRIG